MFHAVLTNKGLAWLEHGGSTVLDTALTALRESRVIAPDPDAVREAFVARLRERTPRHLSGDEVEAVWHQLWSEAFIKVREPAPAGFVPDVMLLDPPVEHFRRGWGGKREGAGKKPRRADGQVRVHRGITLDPDVDKAIRAHQQPNETYSAAVERLIRQAVAR